MKETEHLHSVVAYYAIMDEAKGKADPGVESRINQTTIETLEDLIHIIEHDGMGLTIRVLAGLPLGARSLHAVVSTSHGGPEKSESTRQER